MPGGLFKKSRLLGAAHPLPNLHFVSWNARSLAHNDEAIHVKKVAVVKDMLPKHRHDAAAVTIQESHMTELEAEHYFMLETRYWWMHVDPSKANRAGGPLAFVSKVVAQKGDSLTFRNRADARVAHAEIASREGVMEFYNIDRYVISDNDMIAIEQAAGCHR